MIDPGYLLVGRITRVHGKKGKVMVISMTDFPHRFDAGNRLLAGPDETRLREVEIVESAIHKGNYLLTLADPAAAGNEAPVLLDPYTLDGFSLFISTDDLVERDEGEYYYHELIGSRVETADGCDVGIVGTVIRNGAQDLLVVNGGERGEIFIPVVPAIIKEVDITKEQVVIDPPEGLLDLNVKSC
jgi:16S rRNA processing protein RimM